MAITQAFDTVNRQKMLQRLQQTGTPNKLVRLIKMTNPIYKSQHNS
jgi:hypothetical protein